MSSATFFGHRDISYYPYHDKISTVIEDLIVNHNVNVFYNGARGNFDSIFAKIVYDLKEKYPNVKQLMVLSYHPTGDLYVPLYFDETVYLLENDCPPRFAISHTNMEIVKRCDHVISGVRHNFGGAWSACEFARRLKKDIISIFDDELQ